MSILNDKADFGARIYADLMALCALDSQEVDGMKMLQVLAGVMLETILLFDEPEEGLSATYQNLAGSLGCRPFIGDLGKNVLPPAYHMDMGTEKGRALARHLFADWMDCGYEFNDLIQAMIHNVIIKMEQEGQPRGEVFRIFIECLNRAMAYEIAAQELCDIVIDEKMGEEGWSFCESVSALSAISGRALALSHNTCELFSMPSLPEKLGYISNVMTQEAIRLGFPAGRDWRYGLAANDCVVKTPNHLMLGLAPACYELFRAINLMDLLDQSVACAKASGRMIAVAAGGDEPEVEPAIARPVAMAAMTETYKTVCRDKVAV